MKVLILLSEPPVPADYGPRAHALHIVEAIASTITCEVIGFYGETSELKRWENFSNQFPQVRILGLVHAPRLKGKLNRLKAMTRLWLMEASQFSRPSVVQSAVTLIQSSTADIIHIDLFKLAPLARHLKGRPIVLTPHDAYSINALRSMFRAPGLTRLQYIYRYFAYRKLEVGYYGHYNTLLPVSPVDSRKLKRDHPHCTVMTLPLANRTGMGDLPAPDDDSQRPLHAVIFGAAQLPAVAGAMRDCADALRRATAHISGPRKVEIIVWSAKAHPVLGRWLRAHPEVIHWTWVDNYAAALRECDIVIYPQRTGSGMQTKLLDAMECACAVVSTPEVLEPIESLDAAWADTCRSKSAITAAVLALLNDENIRKQKGKAAQAHVRERFALRNLHDGLMQAYASLTPSTETRK